MTELQEKILFVDELSAAITKVQHNIESINYEVYHHTKLDYINEAV